MAGACSVVKLLLLAIDDDDLTVLANGRGVALEDDDGPPRLLATRSYELRDHVEEPKLRLEARSRSCCCGGRRWSWSSS